MNRKEGLLFLAGLILFVMLGMAFIMAGLLVGRTNRQALVEETKSMGVDPMEVVIMAASQTARAEAKYSPMDAVIAAASQTAAVAKFNGMMKLIEIAASQTAVAAKYNGMGAVKAAASQTAAARLPAPSATLLPGLKYWYPPATDDFSPHFTYDSTQWALTDVSTLASLQISGCTLRQAGGHELGPGWSTEASSLQAGDVSFLTILAKYQGKPQFITYSALSGAVFEIASASDFEQCLQDGESILKSITLH